MRALLERSVLAHEIGHVCLGHRDDRPRHEHQADRYAARQLINRQRLEAISGVTEDKGQWCIELGVTPHILTTYLNDLPAA
jgi:Zn-dependent peptidase ImmA (M78 family)